jgi:spermidine synthase
MRQAWTVLARARADEGELELRRRGEGEFLITVDGRVLMNSVANRSEIALGALACARMGRVVDPRVLIGGLGMGCTLRAVLDAVPRGARVHVAELNPVIREWCLGPLATLTDGAAGDPRVTIEVADVAEVIRRASGMAESRRFHAILLDLYEGPHARVDKKDDPLYGSRAIDCARAALRAGGVLAVWGENYDAGFVKRLRAAGFAVETERPGRGGLRHVVYLATAPRTNPGGGPDGLRSKR